jgi:hypothetical protein
LLGMVMRKEFDEGSMLRMRSNMPKA